MTKRVTFILASLTVAQIGWSQQVDSVAVKKDSIATRPDSARVSPLLKQVKPRYYSPIPLLPGLKGAKQSIQIDVGNHYRATHPNEALDWDASNLPDREHYYPLPQENIPLLMPITPLSPTPMMPLQPLPLRDYVIPSRAELDILEILWAKEDVMDTTIYSCIDTTHHLAMEDLNKLLDIATEKKLVRRKIVSPRNEFNFFGVMIEMSPSNIRNRVYEYHSNVDRNLMRTFIEANAYLFSSDSSIINRKLFQAVRKDSLLLKDLNQKLFRVNNK
ncbi:MAG: hypothetical protein ACOY90_01360 [Candidatus Zhuqueibacterota bacterium]